MAFRGQESALAAKWETYRDDVHDAELRAYEVDARVSALDRRVHALERPIDSRVFRAVLWTVVAGSIALAPASLPWRPFAGEEGEVLLAALAATLTWAGPAILYALLGRIRTAVVSLVLRAAVGWVAFRFGLQWLPETLTVRDVLALAQWLPETLTERDVLALAAVIERVRLLGHDVALRRPALPSVPAVPQPPVGLDEGGWRRAVEEMERRVTFAHSRAVTLAEREPRIRTHLEDLERRAPKRPIYGFFWLPTLAALGVLFAEENHLLGVELPGLGIATLLLASFPVSLRGWSAQRLAPVAIVFAAARLASVWCDPWAPCQVRWAWLLTVCALEPGVLDAASRVFARRQ